MAEQTQATAERRRIRLWLSPVWLIPLIAILVGAWLFYQNILHRGALVVLELQSADGLHAGRTEVKVRSVVVGRVEDLRLTEDYSGAIAEVRMEPGTAGLLVKDSLFWVVKPRIGLRGVSGLGTLWSGAYLQLRPGTSDQPASHFRVLEHPPVVPAGAHGLSIALFSTESTSLNIGDPVVYQGRQVGQIAAAEFVPGRMQMRYRAFVRAPFDQLITNN
ncbi:MAG: MlaD family protein, partial [Salinisphaera sp.]|nr:MlaD family protein [Salinisphaera sp.]